MVWNPLRLLKTLLHFDVIGPLGTVLRTLPGITDTGTPLSEILDPTELAPAPAIWLLGEAAARENSLAQQLKPLGYSVTTQALGSGDALVNTPLVIWQGADTGLELAPLLGAMATYQEATLVNFEQSAPAVKALWGSLDDGVMGGVSASQVQWQHGLRFTGQVSTANNGGFASVRTRNLEPPINLGRWQGTVLYAQGDGQRYKWILRDSPGWDSLAYCRSFDTEADHAIAIRTPFLDMVATRRARTVPESTPLNPAQLYSMQLMLSKFEYDGELNPAFQAGAFDLGVQRLAVYRQGPKPVVVLPRGNGETEPQLAAAGLTGVVPQEQGFAVIGAHKNLPPEITPTAIDAIFKVLG
jgi:hypothetical protein